MSKVVYHKTLETVKNDIREIDTSVFRMVFLDDNGEESSNNDKIKYFKVFDDNGLVYLLIEICKGYRDDNDYNCGRLGCFIKQLVIEKAFENTVDFKTSLVEFEKGIKLMLIQSPGKCYVRYNYIFSVKDTNDECISAKYLRHELVHQNDEFIIYSKNLV